MSDKKPRAAKKATPKQTEKEQHYAVACQLFCQGLRKALVVRSLQLQFDLGKSQAYEAAGVGEGRYKAMSKRGELEAPEEVQLTPQEMLSLAEQRQTDAFLVSDAKGIKDWGATIQRLKKTYGELQAIVTKDDFVSSMQQESDRTREEELKAHSDAQQLVAIQQKNEIKRLQKQLADAVGQTAAEL